MRLSATMIATLTVGACSSGGGRTGVGAGTVAAPVSTSVPVSTLPAGSSASFTGYVQQIYSTGDFLLASGPITYTVVMSPTTAVINVRGRQVPRQFISVAGSVEVTGTLDASKIFAQTVLVPTRKDDP